MPRAADTERVESPAGGGASDAGAGGGGLTLIRSRARAAGPTARRHGPRILGETARRRRWRAGHRRVERQAHRAALDRPRGRSRVEPDLPRRQPGRGDLGPGRGRLQALGRSGNRFRDDQTEPRRAGRASGLPSRFERRRPVRDSRDRRDRRACRAARQCQPRAGGRHAPRLRGGMFVLRDYPPIVRSVRSQDANLRDRKLQRLPLQPPRPQGNHHQKRYVVPFLRQTRQVGVS